MKTRELTAEERAALDSLWATYLEKMEALRVEVNHGRAKGIVDAALRLWPEYTEGYAALGIVATLAGYRMRIA